MSDSQPESYTDQQVQQILQLALARRSSKGENLSRQQVSEIAAELGVSREDYLAAEQEWLSKRGILEERAMFDREKKRKFRDHALQYCIVNVFLIAINFVTSGGVSWAIFVVLAWGLGLALDAWATYQTDSDEYQKQFDQWQRKRQRDQLTSEIATKVTTKVQQWLDPSK